MKPNRQTILAFFVVLLLLTTPGMVKAEASPASATIVDVHAFLPEADELDGKWRVQNEGERTREEVIQLLGERGDELIESLGWSANAFRNFERMNITDPNSFYEPTGLTVSIHVFADSEGAADALRPLSEWVADSDTLEAVQVDSSGDNSRAFSGLDGRLPTFVLYVQEGNLVIRVGALSMLGDPREAVIEVTELILEKVDAGQPVSSGLLTAQTVSA